MTDFGTISQDEIIQSASAGRNRAAGGIPRPKRRSSGGGSRNRSSSKKQRTEETSAPAQPVNRCCCCLEFCLIIRDCLFWMYFMLAVSFYVRSAIISLMQPEIMNKCTFVMSSDCRKSRQNHGKLL